MVVAIAIQVLIGESSTICLSLTAVYLLETLVYLDISVGSRNMLKCMNQATPAKAFTRQPTVASN